MKKVACYLLIGAVICIVCVLYLTAVGSTHVLEFPVPDTVSSKDDLTVTMDEQGKVTVTDLQIDNGKGYVTVKSVAKGNVLLQVFDKDDSEQNLYSEVLYVHRSGVITENNYFGDITDGWLISTTMTLYLAIALYGLITSFQKNVRDNLYQYRNVRHLGLIIYLLSFLLGQALSILTDRGLMDLINSVLSSVITLSSILLPIAFVMFIFVTISNIQLIRNEGRNWRNMLGCILGMVLCVSTLFPWVLEEFLQNADLTIINVHDMNKFDMYIFRMVEVTVLVVVAYMECVLLATIILSVKAARRIPAFDKDYILILGCQINKDGTLTKLLQGRTDRAVEFSRMQKQSTGKELVFVPSGGKGNDEVIAEAEAIRNYLVSTGIPEKNILVENKSANTFENLRNSARMIREQSDGKKVNIAFSTTNYHVFRAGIFATEQGIRTEGIGAKTKSYFWINAFIREFVATLYSEVKSHLVTILAGSAVMWAMIIIDYMSNNL